jgi:hypothetical protein
MSRVVDRSGQLAEPSCGWVGIQQGPQDQVIAGVEVDVSLFGKDYEGRGLRVIVAA